MLGRDSEDEIWSRFVFEFVIWPQDVTLVRWTQSSGPLCLWQCFWKYLRRCGFSRPIFIGNSLWSLQEWFPHTLITRQQQFIPIINRRGQISPLYLSCPVSSSAPLQPFSTPNRYQVVIAFNLLLHKIYLFVYVQCTKVGFFQPDAVLVIVLLSIPEEEYDQWWKPTCAWSKHRQYL